MERDDLKAWRRQFGLSQAQLAQGLGVSPMTVARWEWGTRRIPPFLHLALKALEFDFEEGGGIEYGSSNRVPRMQAAE
uniref:XRE family transcriptional regulator n=1 Tax=Desulfobacca acetoxidans TaxID=60893 RepID=A0A7V4LC78_9BACT